VYHAAHSKTPPGESEADFKAHRDTQSVDSCWV
jgi:hypothetical protein